MNDRLCNNFRVDGNSCSHILSSLDGNNLLLDIIETEKRCIREDPDVCNKSTITKLKNDEIAYWECVDMFCHANSDRIIKGRKYYINKLEQSFEEVRKKGI